jgi:threonine aldolase
MRQAGMLAAAGIYALDHHVFRLEDDHDRAKAIAEILQGSPFVKEILPVTTNIVIAQLEQISPESYLEEFADKNIRAIKFGKDQIRMVTHLGFTDQHLEAFKNRLQQQKN